MTFDFNYFDLELASLPVLIVL